MAAVIKSVRMRNRSGLEFWVAETRVRRRLDEGFVFVEAQVEKPKAKTPAERLEEAKTRAEEAGVDVHPNQTDADAVDRVVARRVEEGAATPPTADLPPEAPVVRKPAVVRKPIKKQE